MDSCPRPDDTLPPEALGIATTIPAPPPPEAIEDVIIPSSPRSGDWSHFADPSLDEDSP